MPPEKGRHADQEANGLWCPASDEVPWPKQGSDAHSVGKAFPSDGPRQRRPWWPGHAAPRSRVGLALAFYRV